MPAGWCLTKEFTFEASHQLMHHDGKCARLHGHSWKMIIGIHFERLIQSGPKTFMGMDYADISARVKPVVEEFLDHWHLNDTLQVDSPTSEYIAMWVFKKLWAHDFPIDFVTIEETCTSACTYTNR